MFERALDQYPVATLIAVGVGCLLVAAAIAVAMDWFIGQAEAEPGARRPHPFDPQNATHCDRCWRESLRRRAVALEASASRTVTPIPFRSGRWPRI